VTTAAELQEACAEAFTACDVLVMTAAVADFRPVAAAGGKLKKAGRASLTLELEPTADVLGALAAARVSGQTIVGFAAEHGAGGVERAREKLARKGADMIVLNDVSNPEIGFESRQNAVTLVEAGGEVEIPLDTKEGIAEAILERVATLLLERSKASR
jgi:phosphopantothenoylcysteine decarboxylase / phosphopantothenate---cysteine ligase